MTPGGPPLGRRLSASERFAILQGEDPYAGRTSRIDKSRFRVMEEQDPA